MSCEALREDHRGTLTALNQLAACLSDLGRHKEALLKSEEAYRLSREALGEKDPCTLTALNHCVLFLQELKRFSEALPKCKDSYRLHRKSLGDQNAGTLAALNNWALCLSGLDRDEEALPKFEKGYRLSRKVLGSRHPHTPLALNNWASCLAELGRHEEALPKFEEAYQLSLELLGEQHHQTLLCQEHLAACLAALRLDQKNILQLTDVEQLMELIKAQRKVLLRNVDWFRRVERLTRAVRDYIPVPGRYSVPSMFSLRRQKREKRRIVIGLSREWPMMFDELSVLLADALELQPAETLDEAYEHTVGFHAVYLKLCAREWERLVDRIPLILGRIHGRRIAAMVGKQLIVDRPDDLSVADKEFLEVRRKLSALVLKKDNKVLNDSRDYSRKPNDRAQLLATVEGRSRDIDHLNRQLKSLRPQLSARMHSLLNPSSFGVEGLRAQLKPWEAMVLLVDHESTTAESVPYALLVRQYEIAPMWEKKLPLLGPISLGRGSETWSTTPVQLPSLGDLVELLKGGLFSAGSRGVERRGEHERLGFSDDSKLSSISQVSQAKIENLEALVTDLLEFLELSRRVRAGEPILEHETFRAFDNSVSDLAQDVEAWRDEAIDTSTKDATYRRLKNPQALLKQARHLEADMQDLAVGYEEAARLMHRHLWAPLQAQMVLG